jgi:hypothetical protein
MSPTVRALAFLSVPRDHPSPPNTLPSGNTIVDIINATFRLHRDREGTQLAQCTAAQWVTQSEVQLPKAGAHTQSAYFVTFAPTADDIDFTPFRTQVIRFIIQQWWVRRPSAFGPYIQSDQRHDVLHLTNVILPATKNPWTPFLDMKLPPCNSWTEKAYGIAVGLTTQVIGHSPTPFLLEHLRELFFDFLCQCTDFLERPTFLADLQTFTDHVGFCIAQWNAPTLQPCRVLYVCTSTEPLFWNIYPIMNPDDNTAYTWYVHGFPVQLSPFPPAATPPKNTKKAPFPSEPEKTLHLSLTKLSQQHMHDLHVVYTDRFQAPLDLVQQTELLAVDSLIAFMPCFKSHTNNPIAYRLFFEKNEDTAILTDRTLAFHPGFPTKRLGVPPTFYRMPKVPTFEEFAHADDHASAPTQRRPHSFNFQQLALPLGLPKPTPSIHIASTPVTPERKRARSSPNPNNIEPTPDNGASMETKEGQFDDTLNSQDQFK